MSLLPAITLAAAPISRLTTADGDFSLSVWANVAEIGELTTLASIGKYYPGNWSAQREYAMIEPASPVEAEAPAAQAAPEAQTQTSLPVWAVVAAAVIGGAVLLAVRKRNGN